MFDALTEKLTSAIGKFTRRGRLSEADIDQGLREIRVALLEADVNFRVAGDLVNLIRDRAVSSKVVASLAPGEQIATIIYEELVEILTSDSNALLPSPQSPSVAFIVGLQGSGKTTTSGKLAMKLKREGHRVLLVAADLRRPAAIEQLVTLGKSIEVPVHAEATDKRIDDVVKNALEHAKRISANWMIVDTAGRLHLDDELMEELEKLKNIAPPTESLLVVDAMTGQDAVGVASEFNERIGLTGLVISKLDGDARGGAALSISRVTGVPVKFVGTGERQEDLETFHPDRLASRILGMGDLATLAEKAKAEITDEKAKQLEKKMRNATFDLDDFLEQLQQLRRMGPISGIMEMIPGFSSISKNISSKSMDDRNLDKVEAIVFSMTPLERRKPEILNGSRKRRIASGSGTKPQDVNQLLNQFNQSKKLMKQISSGKNLRNMRGLLG